MITERCMFINSIMSTFLKKGQIRGNKCKL
nr:MAG TPA: hypothetical protein [Caudoviricetes sp.]DAO90955.1 MAG TPA: hypothetical protein [Caudoviricetes sp.]